jgi:hypothetical protein
MFYTMTQCGRYWNCIETKRNWQNIAAHHPELNGSLQNTLETTVSYKAWARLTPTLTHVITYVLMTSGAEDRAMSAEDLSSASPFQGTEELE